MQNQGTESARNPVQPMTVVTRYLRQRNGNIKACIKFGFDPGSPDVVNIGYSVFAEDGNDLFSKSIGRGIAAQRLKNEPLVLPFENPSEVSFMEQLFEHYKAGMISDRSLRNLMHDYGRNVYRRSTHFPGSLITVIRYLRTLNGNIGATFVFSFDESQSSLMTIGYSICRKEDSRVFSKDKGVALAFDRIDSGDAFQLYFENPSKKPFMQQLLEQHRAGNINDPCVNALLDGCADTDKGIAILKWK